MSIILQLTFQDYTHSMVRNIRGGIPGFLNWAIAALVVVFSALLVYQIMAAVKQRRLPRLLFYDLAALHSVPRAIQKRLIHIARTHKIGDPARLFVCPDVLRRIESLELSQAAGDRERRRLEEFFARFRQSAYGDIPAQESARQGGEK